MDNALLRLARSVLLPAFAGTELGDETWQFLAGGGRAVLLGESREEYVRREMDDERVGSERANVIRGLADRVASAAGAACLIAVDQEMAGIARMHRLVRPLPSRAQALTWSTEHVEDACRATGEDMADLGVNLALSPVVDVVTTFTPWLYRRELGPDADVVARCGAAYIRGLQASGRVAATAKHFPGHTHVPEDPALVEAEGRSEPYNLVPFREAIRVGVRCVMVGPAVIPSIDPDQPASTSRLVTNLLREGLGFTGLIISDDLDEPSIARGRSIPDTAVAALRAGVDLLLVAGGEQVEGIAYGVANAVGSGSLSGERLEEASARVGLLADSLASK